MMSVSSCASSLVDREADARDPAALVEFTKSPDARLGIDSTWNSAAVALSTIYTLVSSRYALNASSPQPKKSFLMPLETW